MRSPVLVLTSLLGPRDPASNYEASSFSKEVVKKEKTSDQEEEDQKEFGDRKK